MVAGFLNLTDGISDRKIETDNLFYFDPKYLEFIPEAFRRDPVGYFNEQGRNVKSGDIKYGENNEIRDDPTAVKDFPSWSNNKGDELKVVAKRVNIGKSQVRKSGDPFYEFSVMQIAGELDLPVPRPIAKIHHNGIHIIVMERVEGIRWMDFEKLALEYRLSIEDINKLIEQAQAIVEDLRLKFSAAGIERKFELKDMVFEIDWENRKIIKITPTDWEKTKINREQVDRYRGIGIAVNIFKNL